VLKHFALAAAGLAAIAAACAPHAAAGDHDPVVLHLIGDTPAVGEDGPRHFVLNATVNHDDGGGDDVLSGWLALLSPSGDSSASSSVKGDCVRGHCEFSVGLESDTIKFSGDLDGHGGLTGGKFENPGIEGYRKAASGPVTFARFTDSVPGLGELVKPDAFDSRTLDDLLMWTGIGHGFQGIDEAHPIDDDEQEDLSTWQLQNQRAPTGLLFVSDLALMTSLRADAQKAVGWTTIGGSVPGWSAGYPAKLLPVASRNGAAQTFASTDGKASLIIAIDPPLDNETFNTRMQKLIDEDVAGRTDKNYGLAGDNMQISYVEGGRRISAYYYRREGGVARLTLAYPAPAESSAPGQNPLDDIASIIEGSFRVSDTVKPAP
jgi:hypothetical protein